MNEIQKILKDIKANHGLVNDTEICRIFLIAESSLKRWKREGKTSLANMTMLLLIRDHPHLYTKMQDKALNIKEIETEYKK